MLAQNLISHIRGRLASHRAGRQSGDRRVEAAVLVPIFEQQGELHFLLTQRTETVATHKGQISFPGGVRERGDGTLRETALRETEEEVGISPLDVDVLGAFDEYLSVTNLFVTPFVGYLREGFRVAPSSREVQRVLEVPCRFFSDAIPGQEVRLRRGEEETVYSYRYRGDMIWGLTAVIIKDLVDFLKL